MSLTIQCKDFLAGNGHLYAVKARRKKIAIVGLNATNGGKFDLQLNLAGSKLTAAGKTYDACDRDAVVKRLG